MWKRLPLLAAFGAVLLLTACGPTAVPTASPTASSSASVTPSPSPTPTTSPTATPTGLTAGDCTRAEMEDAIPTVYTVFTEDSTTPVTLQYTAFNHDGSLPVETLTTVGPVINIVGYACTDAASGAVWTLTATHTPVGTIGCTLDFGGLIVKTDSAGQEDAGATVDCSANPGE